MIWEAAAVLAVVLIGIWFLPRLMCRVFGHQYRKIDMGDEQAGLHVYNTFRYECDRCGKTKT